MAYHGVIPNVYGVENNVSLQPNPNRCGPRMMNRLLAVLITLLIALPVTAYDTDSDDTDVAVLLDGSKIAKRVLAIDEKGQVTFEDSQTTVDLQGLRRITRPVGAADIEAVSLVHLVGGGVISATKVTLTEDHAVIDWSYGEAMELPLSAVRGVRITANNNPKNQPTGATSFTNAIGEEGGGKDRLFVLVENKVQSLSGVMVSMDDKAVKFLYQEQERTITRDKVFGVLLAGTGKAPNLTGLAELTLADGSTMWAKLNKMRAGLAYLKLVSGPDMVLPWATVRGMRIRSDRLVFMSDLNPTDVYERAIAQVGSWKKDKSVRGRPLSIRGRVFDKGIGVHATCRLTFDRPGQFNILAATIGIDDATNGRGDCEFVVLGDGKELQRVRIKGNDEPHDLRVKIEGVKTITLAVEPGKDFDFSDHGNWGDVRLIKE